ncbi:MAG: hypothetical protein E7348_06690 [Clostridiales bacterium]|nr:hypothetical protein [Clostridiales bacterium]
MDNPKILFIVEGSVREKKLYEKITKEMGISANMFAVCANIHMLYTELKKEEFHLNIDDFLLTLEGVAEEDKALIKKQRPFTYIYLIFDLDLQHYDISDHKNVERGLQDVREMLSKFDNETDPTIGKMYINYPMVESYRDCEKFFDENYINRTVELTKIVDYKKLVGERGLKINLSKYTFDSLIKLTKQNIYKANYIVNDKFKAISYDEYLNKLTQEKIFEAEENKILKDKIISVLHSGFFFMADYWGNKEKFYDKNLT